MAMTNNGTYGFEVHATGTGSAPTLATDGQPLKDLDAITVMVAADATRTLSGAGTLQCYVYDPSVALWARAPGLDFACSTASVRTLSFQAVEVIGGRNGRVVWIPNGVTISAGGVTVHQLGHSNSVVYS